MSSFIKDRNNKIEYRNNKKLNLKSICITKIPEPSSFEDVREICAAFGQIHSVHEVVKNCPYKFINFEFLENEEELIRALNEKGIECRKGQRKQEQISSKKSHLIAPVDVKIFKQADKLFEQNKVESEENWEKDDSNESDKTNKNNFNLKSLEESINGISDKSSVKSEETVSENSSNLEKSPCVFCKKDAAFVCVRCGDFYCSKDCQKTDWPSHRYICFTMPELVLPSQRTSVIPATQNGPSPHILKELQKPVSQNSFKKFQIVPKSSQLETKTKLSNVKAVKAETEIEVYPHLPVSGDIVNIVSVFNARHVYIRSLEPAADKEFRTNLYSINQICRTAPPITSLPAPKSYACTDFQGDGLFYRVRVVKSEDLDNITVRYVDFGNVEVKSFKELRQLPEKCKEFKIFKIAVTLNEIPAMLDGNKKMLNYLQQISDDVTNKYQIFYENERAIFKDVYSGECLNKQLLNLINFKQQIKEKDQQSSGSGESGRGSGSDSSSNESLETVKGKDKVKKERVLNPPFSFNYLTVGEDIPVIIVDNSLLEFGTFSCCLEKNATSIERISKKAQQYAEKDPHPYSPIEKEYVLVRFSDDNEWYRAQVTDVVEDNSFEVTFVDYGNVNIAKSEDIRHYPETFTEPCQTTTCLISDLPCEIDAELIKELRKEIQFPSIKTIKKVVTFSEEGYAIVEMGLTI